MNAHSAPAEHFEIVVGGGGKGGKTLAAKMGRLAAVAPKSHPAISVEPATQV